MARKQTREELKNLKRLYDKTDLQTWSMAITYLLDTGFANVVKIDKEKMREVLRKKDEEANGMLVLSVEYQLELIDLAKEIANITTPWQLLIFAKEEMHFN